MPISTTYTDARANLARLWDRLERDRELLVIERRGHEAMAMLPMAEVEALLEAAHLLRSPANARRLLRSLQRALEDEGAAADPRELARDLGLA
ncbi:MAG: type II toxin-antitoxin system Phd/YefM family antitoxin [Acidobacteriota bacterium]